MKKVGIIIASIIIATIVTYVSLAIVRTTQTDVCHIYKKAGFPLSYIEELMDQPSVDQCLPYALSKAFPTFNGSNLAIDWSVYFVLSAAGLAVIGRKKRPKAGS